SMGFRLLSVKLWRFARLGNIDRASEAGVAGGSLPKLLCDVGQQLGLAEIWPGLPDSRVQDFLIAEPLENRDQIGEGLVKSQHIRTAGDSEIGSQPVKQRVRHFMRNNVMRKTSIEFSTRQVVADGLGFVRLVVAEIQRSIFLCVVRVLAIESGW